MRLGHPPFEKRAKKNPGTDVPGLFYFQHR